MSDVKLSAFDLDHTLTKGNSSFNFCHFLLKHKILSLSTVMDSSFCYFRHLFLGMSLTELHHAIFNRVLFGRSMHFLEDQVDRFLKEYLFSALYMPAVYRLRLAQHLGHYTVILSNSPSFLVKSVAEYFGVNEWKATEYALDEQHNLSRISIIMQGADKALHLNSLSKKLGIRREAITAYSDSYHDLDFLKASGTPIAVNPDKRLRAVSIQQKWSII
ncbi:MAG TPA: HAD-IB family phosphatase [Rhabdochlamydiaceae bacterium]|nr:HAD-IB family phosphatase [Rhabdochlamydiaceae bacterium]